MEARYVPASSIPFFFIASILPVRIGPDPFFHDRPSNFHPPSPLLENANFCDCEHLLARLSTYLSTSCRRSLGGRGRGARGNVIDSLAGEEAKDRYGGTSSPVAAVVNRYPGCLICIHPGTRASQRLERYSKGGRFPCSPRVSLRVFVCNSSRFPLFVLSALSLLLPIIPRSKPPGFLPSSFHLTFCAISPRFSSPCNDPRSCRGAAFHFCRREVIVSNRAKPAIRLASAAASMVVASAPCSSHGVTAHSVANRDRERLAPGLSFRVTRVTRVP